MNRSPRRPFFVLPLCLPIAVALGGCVGTETDNPTAGDQDRPGRVPDYESPIQLSPQRGAPPCVPPQFASSKPAHLPLWGVDGPTLVGADRYSGLRVLDASDPRAPVTTGALALAGEPLALLVEPGPYVVLALDEYPEQHAAAVPEPSTLEPVARLVRFDARGTGAPLRQADVEIEGELWGLSTRAGLTWVMSARDLASELSCDHRPYGCRQPNYAALILSAYRFADGGWQREQRVELPLRGPAWAVAEGFASFEVASDTQGDFAGGEVHVVRFGADGRLGAVQTIAVSAPAAQGAPISLAGDQLRVLLDDSRNGGGVLLAIHDLNSGEPIAQLNELGRFYGGASRFSAQALYMDEGQDGAVYVDTRDPRAPRATPLPAAVQHAIALDAEGTKLLGIGPRPGPFASPGLTFTLLQVQDGVPAVRSQLQIPNSAGMPDPAAIWIDGERALFAYERLAEPRRSDYRVGALAFDGDALRLLDADTPGYPDEALVQGGVAYLPDAFGVALIGLDGAAVAEPRVDWNQEVSAYARAGDYDAALVRERDGTPELELVRGPERHALPLSPGAQRIVVDGERVLVLSTEPVEQCRQRGLDCTGYEPNVEIFALGDPPRSIARLPLPDAALVTGDGQVQLDWDFTAGSPFALGAGRHVFIADFNATCTREAACMALAIEAKPIGQAGVNVAASLPAACPPGTSSCEQMPAPAPTVYGEKRAQRVYLLDARGAQPRFGEALESVLRGAGSRFAPARPSQNGVLITRMEIASAADAPGVGRGGPEAVRAHFFLDRFALGDDGELHAAPEVNVPGYPLALLGDGARLISVEPAGDEQNSAKVHHLSLDEDGARVLQTLAVDGRYGGLELVGERALYLQRSGEGCSGRTRLTSLRLPDQADGELRAAPGPELPGADWTLADVQGDRALLVSQSLRYALIELGEDGPQLRAFVAGPRYLDRPQLNGDAILGAGALAGKQRLSLAE